MNACEVNVDITMSAPQTEQSTARIHSQPPEEPIQHAKHDDPLTLLRPTIAIRNAQRQARPPGTTTTTTKMSIVRCPRFATSTAGIEPTSRDV